VVDAVISADGRSGRLAELATAEAWLVFVCHWQTLYSDGAREGLKALDEVAARLTRTHGARLLWLTVGEIARYRAASEGCLMSVRSYHDGWAIDLDAAIECPDFTISLQAPELDKARIDQVIHQAANESAQTRL
jgi:hypothetical protein